MAPCSAGALGPDLAGLCLKTALLLLDLGNEGLCYVISLGHFPLCIPLLPSLLLPLRPLLPSVGFARVLGAAARDERLVPRARLAIMQRRAFLFWCGSIRME